MGSDIVVITLGLRCLVEYSISPADRRWSFPPLAAIFLVHLAWVTVQIFNPYGISILAGLAAYKVYMSFLLLYFIAYIFLRSPGDLRALMWLAVVILAGESLYSIYQFNQGEAALIGFSPNYARALFGRFTGAYFRPFGTTATPGGASTLIYLAVPLLLALFFDSRNIVVKLLIVALFLLAAYALFILQVRSAMIKAVVGMLFVTIIMFWRKPAAMMGAAAIVVALIYGAQNFMEFGDARFAVAKSRFSTLSDIETFQNARATHFDQFIYLWNNAPLGIGLSRVGAASNYFQAELSRDQFYGREWSWADNLYRTLVVELGFPGLLFFLTLMMGPFVRVCYRTANSDERRGGVRLMAAGCAGLLGASIAGHWGSEISLYMPESAYYWLFLGAAMRFSETLPAFARPD